MAKNNLPGYPGNKQINKQAAQLAHGAVPTKRSIRRQYALPLQSNRGFTEALIHLLQSGQGNVSSGFDAAIQSQQGIDQAAAARLAGLGGPDAAGSAAAVGGLGGSAMSSLVAQGAAAKNYASQIPAVAASRGQLMNAQLLQQRNQALTQRQEDYRSALQQALQTVRQNALAEAVARANIRSGNLDRRLQLQGMKQSHDEFISNQAQQAASLAEQQREFNYEHSPAWLKLQAQVQAAANGTGSLAGMTPSQVSSQQRMGSNAASDYVLDGLSMDQAIKNLVRQKGINPRIAILEAKSVYSQVTPPDKHDPNFRKSDGSFDTAGWKRAVTAYHTVHRSYLSWAAAGRWRKYLNLGKRNRNYAGAPPGPPGPGGHR